jgi:hypothetical protein
MNLNLSFLKYPLLKVFILCLFFFNWSILYAQQVDILPFIGATANLSQVDLTSKTYTRLEPAIYATSNPGFSEQNIRYGGGLHVGVIWENSIGLQTGIRFIKLNNSFAYRAEKPDEFLFLKVYQTYSDRIEVPLHLAYDFFKLDSNLKSKEKKHIRIFTGPSISYILKNKIDLEELFFGYQFAGLTERYTNKIKSTNLLIALEAGVNFNSFLGNWSSLGVWYHHELTPASTVNFDHNILYTSATAVIQDETTGKLKARGSYIMVQLGVKPFLIKK